MPVGRYVVAACVAFLIATPGASAHARDAHPGKRAQAIQQPSSQESLQSMLAAADEWWTLQGSQPPCAGAPVVTWAMIGSYSEWAYYHSCEIELSPHWWATQYAFLTSRRSRRARVRAAAYDLALLMHARGHNLGYRHIPGTVMQGDEQGPLLVPGWAFTWAAQAVR